MKPSFALKTSFAIARAGGRDALARLLGVETITTYHWQTVLPDKHLRYLLAARPDWFEEDAQQQPIPKLRVAPAAS